MEYFIIELPRRLSNHIKDPSQTPVFIPPRLLSMKIGLAFQSKVRFPQSFTTFPTHTMAKFPIFLTTNPSTLSRNRILVPGTSLSRLYAPPARAPRGALYSLYQQISTRPIPMIPIPFLRRLPHLGRNLALLRFVPPKKWPHPPCLPLQLVLPGRIQSILTISMPPTLWCPSLSMNVLPLR